MKRNAAAVWQGGLRDGAGTVSTESNALSNASYTFGTRFEQAEGSNPEELLAAAHASCYSMALALVLGESQVTPERIDTTATVNIEPDDGGFTISAVHLEVHASIPDVDPALFETAANQAKAGCPVSKLFNAEITLATHLKS